MILLGNATVLDREATMSDLNHTELFRRLASVGCNPKFVGAVPHTSFSSVEWDDRRHPQDSASLFVAIRGARHDSHDSLSALGQRGFAGFIGERSAPDGLPGPYYQVNHARRALAALCHGFAGDPARALETFGVTGTNGKSTTVRILASILQADRGSASCGWMSTVTTNVGGEDASSAMTTPEPDAIVRGMTELSAAGGERLVLEVSSHALDQGRVAAIDFAGAIFTNLSRDHFDYHGGVEPYLDAKLRLFDQLEAGAPGVVPVSSTVPLDHPRLLSAFEDRGCRRIRYGVSASARAAGAEAWVESCRFHSGGVSARIRVFDETIDIDSRMVGRHNLANIVAAVAVAWGAGLSADVIQRGVADVDPVRGRLEPIVSDRGSVFVDYAHTPDALRAVLLAAREFASQRLIVVFGCGGDRDRGKRPEMGKIAASLAEAVIVTSDNPRTEEPESIIDDIVREIPQDTDLSIESDRAAAIRLALEMLQSGDVLVVAGKGHETYQEVGTNRVDFDDAAVIRGALEKRSRA